MPALPFSVVFCLWQQHVTRLPRRPQPLDHFHQVGLGHRGAAGARPRDAAADVEKNRASRAGHRRIGIVPNLDQPAVSEIVVPHFLFLEPGRRVCRIGDSDEAIVIRMLDVIDPGVRPGDLMEGEIRPGRELGIVGVNFADLKNAGRGAAISFSFAQAIFVLTRNPGTPGQSMFPEQNRMRRCDRIPFSARGTFKQLQLPAHGIPARSEPDDQLRAILWHSGGIPVAYEQRHKGEEKAAQIQHFPNLDAHLIASVQPNRVPLKKFLSALVLTLVIFAAYAPALRNGFVWDDTALVLRDPLIRSWLLIPEAFQHFLFLDATPSDFYRPIQRLTYVADYAAFVFKPAGYHFTSILCHLGATLALLLLANELLRGCGVDGRNRRRLAFIAALIWAVHPVHVAAVAYISGRADPLAALFGFLGLYCGIRPAPPTRAYRWLLLIGAAALFLLSALSKETGLIFPVLWLAILALRKSWKQLLPAALAIVFVAVSYLSLRWPAEHNPAPRLRAPAPLLVRPLIVARAFAEYTGLLLFPKNLHMDRDVESHPFGPSDASVRGAAWRELQTLAGIVLIAGAIYWVIQSRKKNPAIFGCLVLAFITYLPFSGAFSLNANIAEHWLYLPSAFLFLAAGLALARMRLPPAAIGAVVGLWFVFLGVRTFIYTLDWKDQRTFLERTIAAGGNSARMLINLASQELHDGQLDSAKAHLEAALQKEPDQPFAVINLAVVAIRKEDYAKARELLNRARDLPVVDAQAHELLAIVELKEHERVELLRFRLASRTGPPNWRIERRYIEALDQTGNTAAAIKELAACLKTQWYRAESWQLLSRLFAKSGKTREAAEALEQAKAYDVHLLEHAEVPQP